MKLPRVIIVEGIDRVGKTTLVNKLVEEFEYKVFKPLGGIEEKVEQYEREKIMSIVSLLSLVENERIIFDRLHLSEFVYGMVDRGYTYKDFSKVDKLLSQLDSLLIYVEPVDIDRSSREHGSMLNAHDSWFDFCYRSSSMDKVCCNYFTLEDVVEGLREEDCK